MIKRILVMSCALALPLAALADQPTVQVKPPELQGSRPLEKQTEAAVIRDYLQSWKSLRSAFDLNQPELLSPDFVGTAREKLAATIDQQAKLGIHTRYQDRTHDLQIVFYSPEGLSIQMIDNVGYDEQVLDHDKILATKRIETRYVVVLTPSDVRWSVRIFQAAAK
ncbi:hypothetical protein [Acidipila rosea]|uniref:Uncharacterized protein n=1 Tax=Acidipila rosea TaxID=768535 RepID=A0A4R1L3U2_9BACT|nr:hypothetical protein [Acidipila rosea]TCK72726.1 hypothetical protein C7378_2316 [Acidipila rosea]